MVPEEQGEHPCLSLDPIPAFPWTPSLPFPGHHFPGASPGHVWSLLSKPWEDKEQSGCSRGCGAFFLLTLLVFDVQVLAALNLSLTHI